MRTGKRIVWEGEEGSLEQLFFLLHSRMFTAMRKEACRFGFNISQIDALRHISMEDGITMKELAARLRVTPPSATAIVDRLVEAGVVARRADERDRRALRIALSEKGEKLMGLAMRRKRALLNELFSKLTVKERRELSALIMKLAKE